MEVVFSQKAGLWTSEITTAAIIILDSSRLDQNMTNI